MDELKMPEILPSIRIGGDDAGTEKIVTNTIAAVPIVGRSSKRHVNDTSIAIDCEKTPNVHAGSIFPAIAFPCIVEFLSGTRYGMERPDEFPRMNVPRAHIAGWAFAWILLSQPARNDQVLVHDRR